MRKRNLERAAALWRALRDKHVFRRGYEHKPVDESQVRREAEEARKLMESR